MKDSVEKRAMKAYPANDKEYRQYGEIAGLAMLSGRREGYLNGAIEQHKIDIDKACEWIKNYAVFYVKDNNVFHFGECIADFRKAMEK